MNTMMDMTTAPETGSSGDVSQYLSFLLGGEEYAVDILRVREIRGWEGATPIPNAPSFIKGMINLRGAIVPIIDLRERFKLPYEPYGPTNVIIVVQVETDERTQTMGLVVDAVSEVHDIRPGGLRPKPDFGDAVDSSYVEGIATIGSQMVIVLDVDVLLRHSALEQSTGA